MLVAIPGVLLVVRRRIGRATGGVSGSQRRRGRDVGGPGVLVLVGVLVFPQPEKVKLICIPAERPPVLHSNCVKRAGCGVLHAYRGRGA